MSFIISLYVREGIVLASDSRLTLNVQKKAGEKNVHQIAVGQSDSNYKTFLTDTHIGISTWGDAAVEGVPIGGYIESFISEVLQDQGYSVDEVPAKLIDYFKALPSPPNSGFFVAGYKQTDGQSEQHIWEVVLKLDRVERVNKDGGQGASWRGETDVMTRLIQPVFIQKASGEYTAIPNYPIPWGFFTLQDAIDYATYAVRVTSDAMRFHPRPKTVGGPIDILVIKPNEAFWVQRKSLHA